MERKYSMIITPPEVISCQIKKKVPKTSNKTSLNPHISLCTSFLANGTEFIDKARSWLGEQNPFVFTLRKVDSFSNSSTVYLTSDDNEEIEEIRELYFGLGSLLDKEIKVSGQNDTFVPHLTLDSFSSPRRVKSAKSNFRRLFESPIPIPVVKIEVTEKIGNFRWKTIDCLMIGGGEFEKQLITADTYQFEDNRRASIA